MTQTGRVLEFDPTPLVDDLAAEIVALRHDLDTAPLDVERLAEQEGVRAFIDLHDEDDGGGWPCDGKCASVRALRLLVREGWG